MFSKKNRNIFLQLFLRAAINKKDFVSIVLGYWKTESMLSMCILEKCIGHAGSCTLIFCIFDL